MVLGKGAAASGGPLVLSEALTGQKRLIGHLTVLFIKGQHGEVRRPERDGGPVRESGRGPFTGQHVVLKIGRSAARLPLFLRQTVRRSRLGRRRRSGISS